MNSSLDHFFSVPSLAELETQFRWIPEEHPKVISSERYDVDKLRVSLVSALNEYLAGAQQPLSALDYTRLVAFAEAYAAKDYRYNAWLDNPECILFRTRVETLLRHPAIVQDPVSLIMMLVLKDLKENCPWSWDFWLEQKKKRYMLAPGFGKEHIEAMKRFILSNDLWLGQSESLHRDFFSSVGQVLQYLATTQDLVLQTIPARVELMRRNRLRDEWRFHEVWAAAAFTDVEMKALAIVAENHPAVKQQLDMLLEDGMDVRSGSPY